MSKTAVLSSLTTFLFRRRPRERQMEIDHKRRTHPHFSEILQKIRHPMIDSEVLAYVFFGLSISASLIKVGRWLLHAHPRAVINAVQLSVGALIGLTPVLIVWLVMSGRSTLALTVAAITLLVLVWGVPRWRALFGSMAKPSGDFPRWDEQHFHAPMLPDDPVLVRQSIAVLKAYLERAVEHGSLPRLAAPDRLLNGTGNATGRQKMSTEEALDVLGLGSTAGPDEINEAHQHLQQALKSKLGDTHYLITKIDEAKDALIRSAQEG